MQLVQDETVKQEQLDGMKRRATGLLVAAAVVFVGAKILHGQYGYAWLDALRATAEAAMVGGLADWFAVTAIFRHPLGLPIPHTAIVPTRKDRVGRSLGAFVQRNFLTGPVIEARLRSLNMAERLAQWLSVPEHARSISRQVTSGLASAARMIDDDDARRVIGETVATRVRATRAAPVLGRVLSLLTEGNRHQTLLNEVVRVVGRAIEENHVLIRTRIEEESPWWIPNSVDEKIYEKVVSAIERTMDEIEHDPAHPLRARFDAALARFTEQLENDPELAARIERWKEELLETETAQKFSSALWTDGKAALVRRAEASQEREGGSVERALVALGNHLQGEPELLERLDEILVNVAVALVGRYQNEVGELIESTVASWDPEVTSRRVELAVGRDLQFIRINGTIVGGLAGLAIYLLSSLA